ncbi:hypothetical protein MBLNU230_g2016t1 [Neophaeotheca triangularis]
MTAPDRTRLHITPFNESLLERYIPASLRPKASNVSFHAVQTFPEKGFGFVELPKQDAMKLKNKLNGSTLKGSKVQIEEARPEKKRKHVEDEGEDEKAERKARKLAKKEKRKEDGVIPGHEIEEGRRVKRGWKGEDAKAARKADKEEHRKDKLLFRAGLPTGVSADESSAKKSKDKKSKEEKKQKRREKRKSQAVVEEFAKNKNPVALKDGVNLHNAEGYVDGVGWVGEDGEVIEAETEKMRRKRERHEAKALAKTERKAEKETERKAFERSPAKSPEQSRQPVYESHDEDEDGEPATKDRSSSTSSQQDDSSSGEEDAEEEAEGADEANKMDVDGAASSDDQASSSDSSAPDSPEAEPSTPAKETKKAIHPLEALYKRSNPDTSASKPRPLAIDTSFSFFGSEPGDNDDNNIDNESATRGPGAPPQTPHTKQDLEWRGQRSAAPTPDTAAIGKRFSFSFGTANGGSQEGDIEEDEDEDGAGEGMGSSKELKGNTEANTGAGIENPAAEGGADGEESAFRKFFYETRGENNRAWKRKRREGKKIVRQRENRRVSRRVV